MEREGDGERDRETGMEREVDGERAMGRGRWRERDMGREGWREREMEREGWRERDMGREGWRERDMGERDMEREGWRERDGERENIDFLIDPPERERGPPQCCILLTFSYEKCPHCKHHTSYSAERVCAHTTGCGRVFVCVCV